MARAWSAHVRSAPRRARARSVCGASDVETAAKLTQTPYREKSAAEKKAGQSRCRRLTRAGSPEWSRRSSRRSARGSFSARVESQRPSPATASLEPFRTRGLTRSPRVSAARRACSALGRRAARRWRKAKGMADGASAAQLSARGRAPGAKPSRGARVSCSGSARRRMRDAAWAERSRSRTRLSMEARSSAATELWSMAVRSAPGESARRVSSEPE
mmetsp:Transcript_11048/g.32818  ORF Transcript_11048/g.32818 Transcript_11048/m.32818 type:complete len:216 (-) Transcript_11048:650-1297(-)